MSLEATQGLNYRSAISLNNIGVALLERHALQHAMNTLKDAVHVFRLVFPSSNQPEVPLMTSENDNVAVMLNRAAQRLASTTTTGLQGIASSSCACLLERDSMSVRMEAAGRALDCSVCASDCDEQSREPSPFGRHGFTGYSAPIYIDDTQINSLTDRDQDLDCSIVLLNFAIAHLSMCETQGLMVNRSKEEVKSTAIMLLTLSYEILDYKNVLLEGGSDLHKIILLVAIMLLSHLTRLSLELGNREKAREYYDRLVLKRRYFQELNQRVPAALSYPAAAA